MESLRYGFMFHISRILCPEFRTTEPCVRLSVLYWLSMQQPTAMRANESGSELERKF